MDLGYKWGEALSLEPKVFFSICGREVNFEGKGTAIEHP